MEELRNLLEEAVRKSDALEPNIRKFQDIVMNCPDSEFSGSREQLEVFGDLAYDLEFFVANSSHRNQDLSYFGPSRAGREIREALGKIDALSRTARSQ